MKKRIEGKIASPEPWPPAPREHWIQMVHDWVGRYVPAGEFSEHIQVAFTFDPDEKTCNTLTVVFFTHTYRYVLRFTPKQIVYVEARARTPHAGGDCYSGTELIDPCPLSEDHLNYVMAQILAWELVKIFRDDRESELINFWHKLSSHYESDGREIYHEWEQKGLEIRNQRIYERVK